MWGIKQTILSVAGVSTLGGASVGCYYCFKSKAPESSQSASNKNSNVASSETQTSRTGEGDTPEDTRSVVNPTQRDGGSVSDGTQTTQPESRGQGTPNDLASSSLHTTTSDRSGGSLQVGASGVGA